MNFYKLQFLKKGKVSCIAYIKEQDILEFTVENGKVFLGVRLYLEKKCKPKQLWIVINEEVETVIATKTMTTTTD